MLAGLPTDLADRPHWQQAQYAFCQAMRSPKAPKRTQLTPALQTLETRRLKVYRDLLFNTVYGGVSNAFPILRSILGARRWRALVKKFFE